VVRSGGKDDFLSTPALGPIRTCTCRGPDSWSGDWKPPGIDLSSVTDVVLTHMHMDHVGGLLVDGVKDRLRPDLQIHVAAAEGQVSGRRRISPLPPCHQDSRTRLRAAAKRFHERKYHNQLRQF